MNVKQLVPVLRMPMALLAITACSLTWTTQATAQRGMFGGGGLMSGLLIIEEVQQELGMSDELIEKIAGPASEINDSMRADMRDIMTGGGDQEEVAEMVQEYRDEEQELVDMLDDDQKSRLKQLHYQRMGAAMYSDDDVRAALDINDDQQEAIDDIMAGVRDRMMEAMMDARDSGDRSQMMAAFRKVQEDILAEVNDQLTEEQQKKAEEMTGEKFEFPQRRRGGGGRSDF